ncbi:MAG: hypothetical protein ABIR11_03520 [Candidatus Limnocylindrales bacterium]
MYRTTREGAHGQALVVLVLAIFALIGGLGLIIDGGNAWAQQRITQAANDASAEAGAVVLATNLSGANTPLGGWDGAIAAAVNGSAGKNGVTVGVAYYTDICGTLLRSDGTKASGPGNAAIVGGGTLPTNNHTNPDCPNAIVGPVAGVEVHAAREFDTLVSRMIGFTKFTASTNATAVSGLLQGTCSADSGCIVLPVTAPVTVVSCAKNGNAVPTSTDWPLNTRVIIPLCKNNPGNVGWLDWTPKAGGTSELIDNILTPNNPPIDLPSWQYVTSTGNTNSKGVEDALNTYMGQVVLFPMFDLTCASDPNLSLTKVGPDYGCGDIGGNGTNQWYRIPQFAAFQLEQAYINGSNGICNTGNGATSCLVGKFVNFVTTGTVGPGIGGGTTAGAVIGTQLIK